MLRTNFLKEKLISGKTVIGTWAIIPSIVTTDIIASTGLDFLIIDAEHGPINYETAQQMVIACESRGVSPVMRVGNVDESAILRALDIGVHCIQVPNIVKPSQVKDLIHYAKYPPLGNRGYSPFTRACNYSIQNATTLPEKANENSMTAINIEGEEAIKNIDEILEIEGLDILFIGLYDLSKSLNIPGQVNSKKLLDYLETLSCKINDAGKYCGTITTDKEKIKLFHNMGLKYLVHLVDCDILRSAYQETVDYFKEIQ